MFKISNRSSRSVNRGATISQRFVARNNSSYVAGGPGLRKGASITRLAHDTCFHIKQQNSGNGDWKLKTYQERVV